MRTKLEVETVDGLFQPSRNGPPFTFGRDPACSFCVDEADLNIPRWAGSVSWQSGHWLLTNTSDDRALELTDEELGIQRLLPARRSHLLEEPRLRVVLRGRGRSGFDLTIVVSEDADDPDGGDPSLPFRAREGPDPERSSVAPTLEPPMLTPRNRTDLAALFWEYHRRPGHRAPRARSYREAAAHLGDTAKALEHRIFDLRRRLDGQNYPWAESLDDLALLVLTTGALRRADFEALPERDSR